MPEKPHKGKGIVEGCKSFTVQKQADVDSRQESLPCLAAVTVSTL